MSLLKKFNLLERDPDGLKNHMKILEVDDNTTTTIDDIMAAAQEANDLGAIMVIVSEDSPTLYPRSNAFVYGKHLVGDAVSRGPAAIVEWINSPDGIHYRDEGLRRIYFNPEHCTYKLLLPVCQSI